MPRPAAGRLARITCHLALSAAAVAFLPSCTPAPPAALDQTQALEIETVAQFLNGLKRLQASFVQTGDLGEGAGMIWLDRPGKLRIDYAGPEASIMVANAGRLLVFDRKSHATTSMAVSRTPLGILLAPVITLTNDVTVESLRHDQGRTQVTLRKTSAPGQGTLTLWLRDSPMALASVTLVDARGRTLTMALSDVRTDPVITPDLFRSPVPAS